MYKILTFVGTRPELIKMSCVIELFDQFTENILVHTGQNYDYELNKIFFEELNIRKPNYFLDAASSNASKTISNIISKAEDVLEKEKPDAVLVYGDTNSCLSVIPAKKRKIPIFHMEAGNRSFDQRVPEELNRKIVDHLSDFNFVLTEHARRYLILEGIKPETIIKTGSHMKEVLDKYDEKIKKSKILNLLNLKKEKYFLISMHREENVDNRENLNFLIESINTISKEFDLDIIISTHPRTKDRLNKNSFQKFEKNVRFLKPFGFFDYIKLQKRAYCVVSDSGTITEESALLNFPAITIRESHERPEGMDEGILIMSGLKKETIINSIKITKKLFKNRKVNKINDYESMTVSNKILKAVLSNIDYVNRTTWYK